MTGFRVQTRVRHTQCCSNFAKSKPGVSKSKFKFAESAVESSGHEFRSTEILLEPAEEIFLNGSAFGFCDLPAGTAEERNIALHILPCSNDLSAMGKKQSNASGHSGMILSAGSTVNQ